MTLTQDFNEAFMKFKEKKLTYFDKYHESSQKEFKFKMTV